MLFAITMMNSLRPGVENTSMLMIPLSGKFWLVGKVLKLQPGGQLKKMIIQTDCISLERVWQETEKVRIKGAHIISELKGLGSSFLEVKLLS
jgi:hypothetical protein